MRQAEQHIATVKTSEKVRYENMTLKMSLLDCIWQPIVDIIFYTTLKLQRWNVTMNLATFQTILLQALKLHGFRK